MKATGFKTFRRVTDKNPKAENHEGINDATINR
jgi:hypothetical protein